MADDASDTDPSLSESESLWSQDEDGDSESGSDFGEDEGDTFLIDSDLWEDVEARGEPVAQDDDDDTPAAADASDTSSKLDSPKGGEHQEAPPPPFTGTLEDLSKVLSGVDKDAAKKAEEKFRTQQGEEARVRREGGYYLNAMKKEYDARGLIQDEHCLKVLNKLAYLKPEPDGRYRNLMDLVSDTDVLLEAYRRVKAGPGGDPSKVSIHNVNMGWFRETQAKLRDGTFRLRRIKVVEVEKRELARIERKKKVFKRAYRKKRQPF